MEKTRHTTIAGEGALQFAIAMGFEPMQLLTPHSLETWLKWKNDPHHPTFWIDADHHDTIGMLATTPRTRCGRLFDERTRVGDPWARRGLTVSRLRLLCRRQCRRGQRNRQWRRHGELLHLVRYRTAHGRGRASARSVRRRHAHDGKNGARHSRRRVLRYRTIDQAGRIGAASMNSKDRCSTPCGATVAANSTPHQPFGLTTDLRVPIA